VATAEEVTSTMRDLVKRFESVEETQRALLPSQRTIEAHCPDLGLTWHTRLHRGSIDELTEGPAPGRWQIRVTINSDDLLALYERRLLVRDAYLSDRLQIRASMTDLLRLRAAL
jgi:predicted lipid carrier protein YhbT